jgi:Carboxypeptidase regulatory-like domain
MSNNYSKYIVLLLLCVLFFPARSAKAQASNAGGLQGIVADPSGSAIPGATLVITRSLVGFQRTVTANSSGEYVIPNLEAGDYVLRVSAKGFADSLDTDVVIATGRTYNLNVQMKVGAASDSVSVVSSGEVLETTSNTLDTTIKPDAVQDLPLNGRDALPFAQLVSGAQSGGDTRFTTYNALPAAALNITVDGMNDNFQRFRSNSTGFFEAAPLRLGAVEEVTVSTDSLTADAGAEGSVALRFELKRGTNQYHGSAFWQTQNSAFNANTYYNNYQTPKLPKASYHINDYGGSISGPILKNKLFLFFNYEQEYIPGQSEGSAYVLTPAAQQGSFTYSGGPGPVNLLSIAAANGFPSTVNSDIANQFSAINTYDGKGQIGTTSLPYENTVTWYYANTQKNAYPTLRVDYQITPTIDWHVAYDLYWRSLPGSESYPGDPNLSGAYRSSYSTLTSGVDWTITPQMVNHFNFGLLNTQEEFNAGNTFNPFTSENNQIIYAPGLVNGGTALSPIVPNYSLPEPRNNPVRDAFDNLTWTHRSHTFTFGGDYRTSTDFDTGVNDPPGNYLGINSLDPALSMFNSTNFPGLNFLETNNQDATNAEDLYATLVGRISSISGSNYVNSATKQYQTLGVFKEEEAQKVGGFYFQDAWRITPHLAINYGMRWQFSGSIHNTNDTYTGPTYADLLGPSKELFKPGTLDGDLNPQIILRPHPYDADLLQPAPNFGFAWNPANIDHGNLVVRGGASITHYDEDWSMFEQATEYSNPGDYQDAYINAGPPTNTPPGEFAAGSLSLGGTTPALNTFPSSFTFPQPEAGSTFGNQPFATVDPNLRSPYIENWYFGVQKKLPSNTVFEVNYVGNHSIHMWQVYDLNEVNIFENGFLQEFQNAQANYAASGGTTFAGAAPLPIMTQAFGAGSGAFTNPTYVSYVGSGQAAALANAIATNSNYFCNLVGNGGGAFTPCGGLGYTSGTSYPINMFQANPFATGEPILLLSDPAAEHYSGLQVQVKHPTGKNLTLMANYAYSHAFTNRYIGDYYTADEGLGNFTTLRDPRLNNAPSPYDQRHTFRAYALYRIPFESHNIFLKEVASGWTISTIFTWQKGRNFKMLGGTNTYNYYEGSSQPDASDSGVVLNGITRNQLQKQVGYYPGPANDSANPILLMNPKVFTSGEVTSESTPGQLGQFIYLVGPQFINDDVGITKVFPIYRHLALNFQAEMLNVFNHPAWSLVDGYSGGTNNPAQYLNVQSSPQAPGTQTNPQGLNSGGARDIQFRVQLAF